MTITPKIVGELLKVCEPSDDLLGQDGLLQ